MSSKKTSGSSALGELLRRERRRRRWTEDKAAALFRVVQSSYHRWETGENMPGGRQFPAIAKFLGINEAEVLHVAYEGEAPTTLTALNEQLAEVRRDLDALRLAVEHLEVPPAKKAPAKRGRARSRA